MPWAMTSTRQTPTREVRAATIRRLRVSRPRWSVPRKMRRAEAFSSDQQVLQVGIVGSDVWRKDANRDEQTDHHQRRSRHLREHVPEFRECVHGQLLCRRRRGSVSIIAMSTSTLSTMKKVMKTRRQAWTTMKSRKRTP